MMKKDILGVSVDDITLSEAVDRAIELIHSDGFHYVVTPNPEFILTAEKDAAFRLTLNKADLSLPDGVGVMYAAKILKTPLREKIPGIVFAHCLAQKAAEDGLRLFLLGAKPGVAERASEHLKESYPSLLICGTHDGYFTDNTAVQAEIRENRADILYCCLGAPKQELWMAQYGAGSGVKLAVGLGGSLDVFAGDVKRAPEIFQKLGLEWFYRLMKEPRRIGRMAKLPLVLWQAQKERRQRNG